MLWLFSSSFHNISLLLLKYFNLFVVSNSRYQFKIMRSSRTWSEARQQCEYDDGDLASIHDARDQLKIDFLTQGKGSYWIGYNYHGMKDSFVWSDGSASSYTKLNLKQPGRARGDDCISISYSNGASKWNKLRCSSKLMSICRIHGKGLF